MNVDIASRLAALRKKFGFSQESLAEQLGISRQAVSKWERAEASPDTDNLIMLARIYGISLDELLNPELTLPNGTATGGETNQREDYGYRAESNDDGIDRDKNGIHFEDNGDVLHIGWDGIHIQDKKGQKVSVGWKGIQVDEPDVKVNVSSDGVYVKDADGKYKAKYGGAPIRDDEKADDYEDWEDWMDFHNKRKNLIQRLPMGVIAVIAFILIGSFTGLWHPAWMVFLLIPIVDSLVTAIAKRDFHRFAYPILALNIFLWIGFLNGLWHPGWVVFLTIPVYYAVVPKKRKRRYTKTTEQGEEEPETESI